MRSFFALALVGLLSSFSFGQEGTAEKVVTETPAGTGKLIAVEVIFVDASAAGLLKEDDAKLVDALGKLEEEGKVDRVSRIRLTAYDLQKGVVQFGETVPVEVSRGTGRGGFGSGGLAQSSFQMQSIGTMVSLTPRVSDNNKLVIEFSIERSQLHQPKNDDKENTSFTPATIDQFQSRSTVSLTSGDTILAGGRQTKSGDKTTHTWLLLKATIQETK